MPPPPDHAARRREQRTVLLIGTTVAALQILFQVLMVGAMQMDPSAFPHRDTTLSDARFWPIQIVLLCVAVAGNAAVDWIRFMWRAGDLARPSLIHFLLLIFFFILISIMFSVSLLDDKIGWWWLSILAALGVIDLIWAYQLEMRIAILDA